MGSRVVNNEVGYWFRLLLSSIPSARASAEQRSNFHLLKAEVYELAGTNDPAIAAQALQVADKARREAHAIALDY